MQASEAEEPTVLATLAVDNPQNDSKSDEKIDEGDCCPHAEFQGTDGLGDTRRTITALFCQYGTLTLSIDGLTVC